MWRHGQDEAMVVWLVQGRSSHDGHGHGGCVTCQRRGVAIKGVWPLWEWLTGSGGVAFISVVSKGL